MHTLRNKKKLTQKIVLPIILVSAMTSASLMAQPFWGERGLHMEGRFEHLIDHLDLNDEQEKKLELIFADLEQHKKSKESHKDRRLLMTLNPEDVDYFEKVNEHAKKAAEHVKSKIIQMAKAKQALYGILDDDQKEKMAKMLERRLSKSEKKMKEKDEG